MKNLTVVTSVFISIKIYYQSPPEIIWGRQFGTDKEEYCMIHVNDGKGNIYVCGKTTGSLTGKNLGKNDGFITKMDASGNVIWTRQFGTSEDENVLWSAIDCHGCVYITGSTTGDMEGKNSGKEDIFIVKYNPDGQLLWEKQFGTDSTDVGNGIYAGNQGFVYLTGITRGKLGDLSFGSADGFMMKLDSSGKKIFVDQFGTPADDFSSAITCDNSSIYICGSTWGNLAAKNNGLIDIITGQFTTEGKLVRFNQLGSEGFDFAMNLAVDKDKNLYLCGSTSGNFGGEQIGDGDCFLTKVSNKGEILWNRQFGTKNHDGSRGILIEKGTTDRLLISGLQNLPPAKSFVRMYSQDGDLLWEKIICGKHNEDASGKDISIDRDGNIY
ncbi:MAG: hypothetical protein Q8910_19840, partial [Bacteroidota bacterium]|nr:hypothetical protein [Bacteroidota bacterium]